MTEAVGRLGRMGHRVADVQRFGLLSAAAVVDRYVDLVDRALGPPALGSASVGGDAAAPGPDLRLLAEATERVAQAYVAALDAATQLLPGPPTVTADGGRLALPDTFAGGTAEATLWLHNPTAQAVPDVSLAATPLVAGAGRTVPLALDPPRLALLPAAGSVPVRLRADVPPDHPSGPCWGLVVCSADPDAPVTVTLRVAPATGGPT